MKRKAPLCHQSTRRVAQASESGDSSSTSPESLRLLSKEFCDILKKKVGESSFVSAYAEVENAAREKRMERRKEGAVLKVVDPRSAAVKKMNRKRKGSSKLASKGAKKAKKPKLKDLAIVE